MLFEGYSIWVSVHWCFEQKKQTGFNPDRDRCGWSRCTIAREQIHLSGWQLRWQLYWKVHAKQQFHLQQWRENSRMPSICAEFQRSRRIWNWSNRRGDTNGQENLFNYKLSKKSMDCLLEEPCNPITQKWCRKHEMNFSYILIIQLLEYII